jgi:hypothetical protein
MILPGKKHEQGDEHECAENKGTELSDSHPLAPGAIANGLKVTIAAERAQRAKIAGLALHRHRIFVGASVIDAGVYIGTHAQTKALLGAARCRLAVRAVRNSDVCTVPDIASVCDVAIGTVHSHRGAYNLQQLELARIS